MFGPQSFGPAAAAAALLLLTGSASASVCKPRDGGVDAQASGSGTATYVSAAATSTTAAADATATADPAKGCTLMKQLYQDKVFYPGSDVYAYETAQFWSNLELMSPLCVFRPTSADEVAAVVAKNREAGTQWAVRGGGHMGARGSNNIDDGMLVVMSNLSTITVAEDKSTVEVGPGLKWGQVYTELTKYELTVAGGRLAPVGVPGLLLGGGVSFLGNQVGWAADAVVAYELVKASGEITTVSATSNPDLFWALKGGSNNFGIVTKFTLRAFPSKKVFAGTYAVAQENLDVFLEAVANYSAFNTDPLSHVVPMIIPAAPGVVSVASILFYDSDEVSVENPPACFEPFFKIPTISSSMGLKTVADLAIENGALVVDGVNDVFVAGTTVGGDYDSILKGIQITANTFIDAIQSLYDIIPLENIVLTSFNWQPISTLWQEASAKSNPGGNALGVDPAAKGTYVAWAEAIEWRGEEYNDAVDAWIQETTGKLNDATREAGLFDPFEYMGDAAHFQNVYDGYGADNRNRLLEISRTEDPERHFQKLWPGGYKLGE